MKRLSLFIVAMVSQYYGYSQKKNLNFPPPKVPVEITATKATGKITIDGNLNEKDWQNAETISDFYQIEPIQGDVNKHKTKVKILFDSKNLYVGVFCKDSLGRKGVRVQDLRRDFIADENDVFGVQIDAQNTKQYAVSFQTTPYGNQKDLQIFNGTVEDADWNALWRVKTTRTKNGYYAEFEIPFKTLRYTKPENNEAVSWGITFYRLARRDYEKTVFPKIPESSGPYRMSYAAKLTNLKVPEPATNLQVIPYTLYNYDEVKQGNIVKSKNNKPKIGGDIKWAITPSSVLDFTINTDFAQADTDRAVNNLKRFNVFFPERRQFFLENSGIWAGANSKSIKPFFSRSIGLDGNFNAQPAPIHFGSRFTNKTAKRTIGALYVKQGKTEKSLDTHFGVARYIHNYGKENNVGIMATHRNSDKIKNSTITIDGLIRPSNNWAFNYMVSMSLDTNIGKKGFAGSYKISRKTLSSYLGLVGGFVDKNYNPTMGYVFKKDIVSYIPAGYYFWRPKNSFFRRWDIGGMVFYYHDFENFGQFQQTAIKLEPIYTWFKNNHFFKVAIIPTWQNINFKFKPLGIEIPESNYYYTTYEAEYKTDASQKLSANFEYIFGNFYNGRKQTIKTGVRYTPIPNIAVTGEYEYNDINGLGVKNKDLYINLYTAGLRCALNPRVQLSAFYQYNSFNKTGRINTRFSWEYLPQSFIYFVFNNTKNDLFNPIQTQNQFISKITFVKQF